MSEHRHGSPYDRGMADSYYNRSVCPHYFKGATNFSEKVEKSEMTEEEIQEYLDGYQSQEDLRDHKIWDDMEGR